MKNLKHMDTLNVRFLTRHIFVQAGGIHQGIDKMLVSKIQELVVGGARSVTEVRRHLKIYVEQDLYEDTQAPPKSNQRFYPSKTTIRSHIYKSVVKERFSKLDQENLQKKIECWKSKCPDETFYFRPLVKYSEELPTDKDQNDDHDDDDEYDDDDENNAVLPEAPNGLLFVHQTNNQKRLLQRYGNELTLLDATYKTTKYSLALFFLVVKTNVNYQVVGSFVLQSETPDAIAEAQGIIKTWNAAWNPSYFMVDHSEEEMSAIRRLFPGVCSDFRKI